MPQSSRAHRSTARWSFHLGALIVAGLVTASVLVAPAARADDTEDDLSRYRSSVIQVFTVAQPEDYYTPWLRPRAQSYGGSAFCVAPRRLMTNAHVVSDARDLMVKRADSPERYQARVLFAGHDCDLAMLTVDDDAFWEGIEPLPIGERPELRDKVQTIGYPTGGRKISVTEGVVSRIEINTYVHSGADSHLTVQTDAAINPGNSGGPVVQDGKVVGVAFQGRTFSQNIGYMIPPSVIRHFLVDVEDGRYDGYPELGIYQTSLENPGLRAYLGVPEGATGVMVLKAVPYASCTGFVERGDVLHAIDDEPIQNDGTIRVGEEFLDFSFVVENKQIGEKVKLTLRRDGEVREVDVPLKGWGARMSPATIYDKRPEYWVLGGYVFLPMTSNYVGWGRGSEELAYYMNTYYRTVAEEGKTREQLVLLSRVLEHSSNRYIRYRNDIVATVDGKVPNDFAHFVKLVDTAEKSLVKIEFEGVNVAPLILDKKRIAEVQDAILKQHGIHEARYVAEVK